MLDHRTVLDHDAFLARDLGLGQRDEAVRHRGAQSAGRAALLVCRRQFGLVLLGLRNRRRSLDHPGDPSVHLAVHVGR